MSSRIASARLVLPALVTIVTTLSLVAAARAETHGVDVSLMDKSVRPTDDFYRFANGAWLKSASIPDEYPQAGAGMEVFERTNDALKKVIVKAAQEAAGGKAKSGSSAQKVGDYYRIAADQALADRLGATPLAPDLKAIEAIRDANGVLEAIGHLHRIGTGAGFLFGIGPDDKDSTRNVGNLYQGGLGLPDRDYYIKTDEASTQLRKAYTEHISRMFVLLGDPKETADTEATQVLDLETRLAKASRTRVELRDPQSNYNKRTLSELQTEAPGADWKRYFTAIGLADPGEYLLVGQPAYFKEFGAALADTPVATWKTYLRWHLLSAAAMRLSKPFVDERFGFSSRMTGQKALIAREKRALLATDASLGEAVGQLYVAQTFSPQAKAKARALVLNLQSALRDRIGTLDWMSAPTKKQAIRKLDSLIIKVGYPDQWRDYSALTIGTDSWYANAARANEWEFQRDLNKLGKPVDRKEWGMTPATVNAYYNPAFNEIVFPAGILQPPLFDPSADDASNYGAIGAVIGHEMTHGFDDQGRQFDADGNLKDWWTPEDAKRFEERSTALAKQYDGYSPLPGVNINGKLTLGENIADLGGLKIAYLAYHKALNGKEPPKIDGFTGDQRFFLSYAQAWRTLERPEMLRTQINTDPHSPAEFRVRGPLANLPAFQEAFGKTSPASPNVISIW